MKDITSQVLDALGELKNQIDLTPIPALNYKALTRDLQTLENGIHMMHQTSLSLIDQARRELSDEIKTHISEISRERATLAHELREIKSLPAGDPPAILPVQNQKEAAESVVAQTKG